MLKRHLLWLGWAKLPLWNREGFKQNLTSVSETLPTTYCYREVFLIWTRRNFRNTGLNSIELIENGCPRQTWLAPPVLETSVLRSYTRGQLKVVAPIPCREIPSGLEPDLLRRYNIGHSKVASARWSWRKKIIIFFISLSRREICYVPSSLRLGVTWIYVHNDADASASLSLFL